VAGEPTPTRAGGLEPLAGDGRLEVSGQVTFQSDVFVKSGATPPTSASSLKAPSTPVLTPGSPAGTDAVHFKSTDAGDYKYAVTAVNQYGESAATALSSTVTVALNQHVPLSIADGGGTFPATAYKIYRTEKNGTVAYYTGRIVPRHKTTGVYDSPTTLTDLNENRPNTYTGLMLDMSSQSLVFKQLSPMIKMNLAIISPAIRWMQLLYGTPIVYAPKKNVVVRNIGIA
jgi:hypothetical protein